MTIALIIVYFWAGASMLFAFWQIETIGDAVNGLLPEDKQLKPNLRNRPGVMAVVFFLWPVAFPVWVLIEMELL